MPCRTSERRFDMSDTVVADLAIRINDRQRIIKVAVPRPPGILPIGQWAHSRLFSRLLIHDVTIYLHVLDDHDMTSHPMATEAFPVQLGLSRLWVYTTFDYVGLVGCGSRTMPGLRVRRHYTDISPCDCKAPLDMDHCLPEEILPQDYRVFKAASDALILDGFWAAYREFGWRGAIDRYTPITQAASAMKNLGSQV